MDPNLQKAVSTLLEHFMTTRDFNVHAAYPDIHHPAYLLTLCACKYETDLFDRLVATYSTVSDALQKTDMSDPLGPSFNERSVTAGFNAPDYDSLLGQQPYLSQFPSNVVIGACIHKYNDTNRLSSDILEYIVLQMNRDTIRKRTVLKTLLPEKQYAQLENDLKNLMLDGSLKVLNKDKFETYLHEIDLTNITLAQQAHLIQNGLYSSGALYESEEHPAGTPVFAHPKLTEWFSTLFHWNELKDAFINLEKLGFISSSLDFGQYDIIYEQVMSIASNIESADLPEMFAS